LKAAWKTLFTRKKLIRKKHDKTSMLKLCGTCRHLDLKEAEVSLVLRLSEELRRSTIDTWLKKPPPERTLVPLRTKMVSFVREKRFCPKECAWVTAMERCCVFWEKT
jgi:hypothetical protein